MNELEYRLNEELMKTKKIINICKIIAILSFVIFIYVYFSFMKVTSTIVLLIPFAIFMISVIYMAFCKETLMRKIKREIIDNLISGIFKNRFMEYNAEGISKKSFDESGIYTGYNKFYSSDRIKSSDDRICIANVTAIHEEENNKNTLFYGIFGYMETEEFYPNEIIIKPDVENKYVSNVINTKNKIIGASNNSVRLENNEFERYFEVYSKDQIKARQVVTVEYMENLLELKQELNALIKILYIGNRKYIAIWNERIIDEKAIYKYGIKLNEIEERIGKILKLLKEC